MSKGRCCAELDLPFKRIDLWSFGVIAPEYLKLNPNGLSTVQDGI